MLVAIILKISALFFGIAGHDNVTLRLNGPDLSSPQVTCTAAPGCN